MVRRQRTRAFTKLQSHYLFEDRFGRPGKGNDKGKVEGMVGYVRRNFLVPILSFESFQALNAHLEQKCLARIDATLRGHAETIGQRMERDLDALLPLPSALYEACDQRAVVHYDLRAFKAQAEGASATETIHIDKKSPQQCPQIIMVLMGAWGMTCGTSAVSAPSLRRVENPPSSTCLRSNLSIPSGSQCAAP